MGWQLGRQAGRRAGRQAYRDMLPVTIYIQTIAYWNGNRKCDQTYVGLIGISGTFVGARSGDFLPERQIHDVLVYLIRLDQCIATAH